MTAYWGVDVQIHIFLTSALVGDWLASRPGRFTPGERAPGTHWIECWVDRRAGRRHGEVKILDPTGARTPTTRVVQPIASRYIDCAIPALTNVTVRIIIFKISLITSIDVAQSKIQLVNLKTYEYTSMDIFSEIYKIIQQSSVWYMPVYKF
jgi:hypothetical protein